MSKQLEDFTVADLDILMEATEAWVNKDMTGEMIGDLLGMVMIRDEAGREKEQLRREQRALKLEETRKKRAEIATLLKTKLILQKRDLIDEGKEVRLNA